VHKHLLIASTRNSNSPHQAQRSVRPSGLHTLPTEYFINTIHCLWKLTVAQPIMNLPPVMEHELSKQPATDPPARNLSWCHTALNVVPYFSKVDFNFLIPSRSSLNVSSLFYRRKYFLSSILRAQSLASSLIWMAIQFGEKNKLYKIGLRTLYRINNVRLFWRRQQQVPPKHCYTYQTTRCHNPEHHSINFHHCAIFIEQLKYTKVANTTKYSRTRL
jgi:hypothetical protein